MALTYTRRKLSSTKREELYDRCRGEKAVPDCNICHLPILLNEPWDESHDPEGPPHALGGTETGVAHRDCNRRHGAEVVIPMVAKAKRGRQKHIGAFRTKAPMPCGRASERSARMGGGVQKRMSLADHHRASKKIFRRDAPDQPLTGYDAILAAVNIEMSVMSPWDRFIAKVEQLVGRDLTDLEIGGAIGAFEIDQTASDYALRLQAMRAAI